MDDDGATLSVGFAIDFHDSFGQLKSLDDIVGEVAANTFREFQRVEQATRGAINLGPATAQVTAFGSAVSREMANATRDTNRAEKAAEGMVRQIDRQIEVFGKSASEIRQMRVELRAAEADSRGLTELATRLRAAGAEIDRLEAGTGRLGATSGRSRGSLTQLSFQLNDVATQAALGAPPMRIFASQAGQIFQIAQMAEGGVKGLAGEIATAAVKFAPLIGVAAVGAAGFALFARTVSAGIDTQKMIDGLGLTKDEIEKLKNTSVTTGDVVTATFQVMAERVGFHLGDVTKWFGEAMDFLTTVGRKTLAGLYAAFVGTFEGIAQIGPRLLSGESITSIVKGIAKTTSDAFNAADGAMKRFGADVTKQIGSNKLADWEKQVAKMREGEAPKKPKADHHAEQLARDAAAIEAQIKNLYALADAYGVSGAAALIAEARVKAESQAIKQRGDIEASVDRQIRLAVAQRVSDAAKGTAALNEQTAIQRQVNDEVAAGNVSAIKANEILQDRLADLPLLAAIEAARARNDLTGITAATDALNKQQSARLANADAISDAARQRELQAGDDRLEQLREELRLIGATDAERRIALKTLEAEQKARNEKWGGADGAEYVKQQRTIAIETERVASATRDLNDELGFTADRWDLIARNVQAAARGMADAFGDVGQAIGDVAAIYSGYRADQSRLDEQHLKQLKEAGKDEAAIARENAKYALATSTSQIGLYGDMAAAAKGFFSEKSKGYQAMLAAEKVFRAFEFAMSVRAMVQDVSETIASIANSSARATAAGAEGVANQSKLPFPWNIAAMAATAAALVAAGITLLGAGGGGASNVPTSNTGTGTVLGDATATSDSIKNAIDALSEVDTLTNTYAREMSASLKSIDSQIGGLATVLVRAGDINASGGVDVGFKTNAIGSVLKAVVPIFGGALASLFGSKTKVTGAGLYGGPQSLGSILGGGFNAQTYSDVEKTKKFLGITTGHSYSTQYGAADPALSNQFTLILRSFSDAIADAAGPLGVATSTIEQRLNGFVVNIGKVDLQGLTGEQIQDKLEAIFGAAADNMANAAFPGIAKFQQVGEGMFETLVRVASTVEAVTNSLSALGNSAAALGIDAKLGLAAQFDSISDLTSAVDGYFNAFYSKEEQAAAQTAQMTRVFGSLGLAMPSTLAAFRALVEAQDLTTAAGQSTYATLLKLAPAFADLQEALNGAKSAADIASERENLQRQLLELQGNTEAIRALDLAKLDESNRALQQQIYAIQDAQDAAKAADDLRQAWQSVGDSIMDEVQRIRGLTQGGTSTDFATLQGQFNAATAAARGGDIDAAKSLPQLSQALLTAANLVASSRQELDRVQAATAASLEATNSIIAGLAAVPTSDADIVAAAGAAQQAATPSANDNSDDLRAALDDLRAELAQMRQDNNAGHAATAGNTGAIKRKLEDVTSASGGDAISVASAA